MSQRDRDAIRQRLAYEAARLMQEQRIPDHNRALKKAAERLGVRDPRRWPKLGEVEAALQQQQGLFGAPQRERELFRVRQEALAAMEALVCFQPRLVGPARRGTASLATGARLFLFAETPEEVVLELMERGIPWRVQDRPFVYADGTRRDHPLISFEVNGVRLELVVLPRLALRNPPLDPLTEQPERGLGTPEVRALGGDPGG